MIVPRLYCPNHRATVWTLPDGRCPVCDVEPNYREIVDRCLGLLRAPGLDNDGGPADLVEAISTVLHNHRVALDVLLDENAGLKRHVASFQRALDHLAGRPAAPKETT